jgi:hypothetical protein
VPAVLQVSHEPGGWCLHTIYAGCCMLRRWHAQLVRLCLLLKPHCPKQLHCVTGNRCCQLLLPQAVRCAAAGVCGVHGPWVAAAPHVGDALCSNHTRLQASHASCSLCRAASCLQRHV